MSKLSWWRTIWLVCIVCAVEVITSPAQIFKTLVSFNGTDGHDPNHHGVVQGTDGNFYGTTGDGGTSSSCAGGCGTVFKITPGGTLTTLHSFDGTDGSFPIGGLVLATDGYFYGATAYGGNLTCPGNPGCGTVFKITPGGTLTTLHSFDGTDGAYPYAALVQGTDGNFYGTTGDGVTSSSCAGGCGTVFKITPGGTLTTLHSFDGTDGENPYAGLIQATNGNLYGTTQSGGARADGTVFKITPGGTLTPLHSFDGTDGENLHAGLIQAGNGNFYGTTDSGGANSDGTVFEITPAGKLTTLHSFDGADGAFVGSGLVQGTDGNFYGVTSSGGAHFFNGTIFEMTQGRTLTTLYSFCAQKKCADGATPYGLIQATNGNLYGSTVGGGANGDGTVFSLSVGLGPFIETLPTSGKVGAPVIILGNNLTSATHVTFNGTKAAFMAWSSEITTTVPTGATTGLVKVTTPKRTLKSNVVFRVTK